jgi:hypothetical protein
MKDENPPNIVDIAAKTPSHDQQDAAPARSLVIPALTVAFLVFVLMGIFFSQPRFQRTLDEFGVELPILSTLALSPYIPWALGFLVLLTVVKEFAMSDRWFLLVSNMAAVGLGVLAIMVYVVGVLWPFLRLVEDLS